jgi:hypothetical protein
VVSTGQRNMVFVELTGREMIGERRDQLVW